MSVVYMCVCAPHVCLEPEEARRECQTLLELELQMVVNYHIGARNCKTSKLYNHWAITSLAHYLIFETQSLDEPGTH